ncbi:lipoprotein [Spiroplasma chrysopicola]|uniref:Lipoprotein n=1 Tax=Spiroplasma chrysopicola DF-1 TaxID=1276227 RepID=R4UFE4_9MOLU|nr:lipoprotein [Spiroplasma chrysopicola]AGM24865.1 hypothetical protein SCHRY_v1c02800 [Spiroplasma chrysopicola DF-1]
MKKLLGFLTSIVVTGSTASAVVACGGEDSTSINQGKTNATTDFKLTDIVKVKNAGTDINQLILSAAIKEGRLKDDISLNILDITDQKNNEYPTANGQKRDGYLVLTFRDDPLIRYTGVITIRFTIVKEATFDITQEVNLGSEYFDVTEYQYNSGQGLDIFIWERVLEKGLEKDAPTDKSAYDFSKITFPPENKLANTSWVLKCNDNANKPGVTYSGEITVTFNWVWYQADIEVSLPAVNNVPNFEQAIWSAVKDKMDGVNNFKFSDQYQNYDIAWEQIKEPSFGDSTSFNILAKPKPNQGDFSLIHIIGKINKDAIAMPTDSIGPIEIEITLKDKSNIDQIINEIWNKTLVLLNDYNLPLLPDFNIFNISSWKTDILNNWPELGLWQTFTLKAINNNSDRRFRGDLTVNVKLLSLGFFERINLTERLNLSVDEIKDQEKVLDKLWSILINEQEWKNAQVSNDRSKYDINYDDIQKAINRSNLLDLPVDYDAVIISKPEANIEKDVEVRLTGVLKVIK